MNAKPTVYDAMRAGTVRTYLQLVTVARPSAARGTCCACHRWDRQTWQLSTRASICEDCCRRKGDQTLGSIATAERKARRWIKGHPDLHAQPQFIANLSGVSLEFVKAEIAKAAQA